MKRFTPYLITAISSQLAPFGLVLLAGGLIGSMFGGINILLIFCSLPLIASGPLLLGFYFNPGWRGLLAGILTLPLGWLCLSITVNTPFIGRPLYIGGAGGSILSLLLLTQRITSIKDFISTMLGIAFGSTLSILALNFIRGEYSNLFLTFLWVWLSGIFFFELLKRRAGRYEAISWIITMIVFAFLIIQVVV